MSPPFHSVALVVDWHVGLAPDELTMRLCQALIYGDATAIEIRAVSFGVVLGRFRQSAITR